MKKQYFLKIAVYVFCVFFTAAVASAQTLPPGQDPGAQAQRYQKDVLAEQQRLESKEKKAPEIKVEEVKPEAPPEGASFILKGVNVTGSTIFTDLDFAPIYAPYIDKSVTFKDIEEIANKIKGLYKAKGYLTTTVYVPEQDINQGWVELRVAEGKMGKVKVEGNRWFSTDFIQKSFHVKQGELLNVKTLQRDILRLNKNYDLDVKTVLSAAEEPQASDIIVKAEENFPWHIGLGEDNLGTRLTGKYRTSLSLRSSNVSGRGDTIFSNTLYSGKSFGQSLNYTVPIGTYGTKFGVDTTYFRMKLGKEYKSQEVTGLTVIGTPYLSWELALSEAFEAYADIGMDIKSIKKKSDHITTSSDQLRLPYFSFNVSKMDSTGQTTFRPQFLFGTAHFLGASKRNHPTASREGTGGFFFKYDQVLERLQKFFWGSYLSMRCEFQAASHTLPSSEQLQIGGMNSVRGYPEGDYLADNGGVFNLDWVMPMYLIPENWKLKGSQIPLRRQIQPVLFLDVGGGELKKTSSGERHSKILTGIGGGLRVNINKNLYLRMDWAQYVGNEPEHGSGPSTFYFTVQSEL